MLDSAELAIEELKKFGALGGRTVVDPTNVGISRDPATLREIARRTELNIVMVRGIISSRPTPTTLRRRIPTSLPGGSSAMSAARRTSRTSWPASSAIGISSIATKDEEKLLVRPQSPQPKHPSRFPSIFRLAARRHDMLDIAEEEERTLIM
jgi:phosphotriesterase-related protein